jgi:hypothetical protein
MCKGLYKMLSSCSFCTAADIEDGLFSLCDELSGTLDLDLMNLKVGLEAGYLDVLDFIWIVFDDCAEDIDRNIDKNRPRAPGARNMKCFVHHTWEVIDIFNKPVMLGDRHCNTGDVCFLEGIFTDDFGADLPGDGYHRDRVHHRIADSGDQVGCSWPGCPDTNADLTGCVGISFRHVSAALLVPDQHMLKKLAVVDFIVKRNNRAARISEDNLNALTAETLQEGFRARALNFRHHSHLSTYPFVGPETKKPPSHTHSGREAGL